MMIYYLCINYTFVELEIILNTWFSMSENKKKGNKGQRFQSEKDIYDALSIEPSELIFMHT